MTAGVVILVSACSLVAHVLAASVDPPLNNVDGTELAEQPGSVGPTAGVPNGEANPLLQQNAKSSARRAASTSQNCAYVCFLEDGTAETYSVDPGVQTGKECGLVCTSTLTSSSSATPTSSTHTSTTSALTPHTSSSTVTWSTHPHAFFNPPTHTSTTFTSLTLTSVTLTSTTAVATFTTSTEASSVSSTISTPTSTNSRTTTTSTHSSSSRSSTTSNAFTASSSTFSTTSACRSRCQYRCVEISWRRHCGIVCELDCDTTTSTIPSLNATSMSTTSVLTSSSLTRSSTKLTSYSSTTTGSRLDTTRVFSNIGQGLLVQDVITSLEKAEFSSGQDVATSWRINLVLSASLTGTVSCITTTKTLARAPMPEEIQGASASTLPSDFAPAFSESEVVGRALSIPVKLANKNFSLAISSDPAGAANIQRMPLGAAPEVYVWCLHSQSSTVHPNNGSGIAISLSVLPAPSFSYAVAGQAIGQIVLARNAPVPAILVAWSASNFPIFYYDEVEFSITPTLPAGLNMSSITGEIKSDPVPLQITPPELYTIVAQSKYDALKATGAEITLSVSEPAQCSLSSIESTETAFSCTIQDANNLKVQALHLLISQSSTDSVAPDASSFSCSADASSSTSAEFTCEKASERCCCWLWAGESGSADNLNAKRRIAGRVLNNVCGLRQNQSYEVRIMASGTNAMLANAPTFVVSDGLLEMSVPHVIKAVEKAQVPPGRDAATSQQITIGVSASLTGAISCIATTRHLSRAPTPEEIKGDYVVPLSSDFVPAFSESDVVGRKIAVPLNSTNQIVNITILADPANAANIQHATEGIPPEVYVWCWHSHSLAVYPDNGKGIPISLSVLQAPSFAYAVSGQIITKVALAKNVSFPTILVVWYVPGFPVYYYDEVAFSSNQTLPAGLDMNPLTGAIEPNPVPFQLTPPGLYSIKAQSQHDTSKSTSAKITVSITEPAQCSLSNIRSTEATFSCSIQDASNLEVQALYVLISPSSADAAAPDPSSFSCRGDAASGSSSDFTCTKASERCCCWLWLGESGSAGNFSVKRSVGGKVRKNACGLEHSQKYQVMTMASGVNPLMGNTPEFVVSDELFELSIPAKKEQKTIAFEMKVDLNYEAMCNPLRIGPAAEQTCKDNMKAELVRLLGAPAEMIQVTGVKPR